MKPFENERKQTDNSLDVERGKTDESFDSYKEKTESKTDKTVSDNRLEADEARTQRRSNSDLTRDNIHLDSVSTQNQKMGLQQLKNERLSEDSAIKTERSKNDLAIEIERSEKEQLLSKLVGLERDATDKNLLEERVKADIETVRSAQLLNSEQAAHLDTKSALTTREEFVAIVSHDLRNPIGAILSFTEMLSENSSVAGIGEDAKQWIEIIKRNAQASLRLISDILDMERIEGGKIHLELASNCISDVITESVESYRQVADAKKISLIAGQTNLVGNVDCDRDRIMQILSNLIGNALKFTPEGGSVIVKAEETASEIKVSISDTGPGIPEEQKLRIFDRFAQLGNKDRRGLGLGLYISKTLVESHHGKIWATSKPSEGSIFCFTVPKR